ncbi:hypothetical protein [Brevibacillus laterosporus]|uniref:hypothetical protein n=1 Tax=Brevibacillus laterosporus TaxID=1465 RepID=UPI000E6BF438|nr:hypothetical protein [Brevibacillus laterosporus]AYB40095.1 hypothetical protein D5F52_18610 [Brevibacillus laterosporus]MBM7111028.1 hypothetical protein [Brevibacillus laterosporus]
MKKQLLQWILIFVVLIEISLPKEAFAVSSHTTPPFLTTISTSIKNRQVIILAVDMLSFGDLQELRYRQPLAGHMHKAGYAALTMRTAGPRTAANGYLLMGSGGQAQYTEASETLYQYNESTGNGETAEQRMSHLTSPLTINKKSALLYPGIFRLQRENENKPYTARIGLMGDGIERADRTVAFYGNADLGEKKQRHAALLGVTSTGEIRKGIVSSDMLLEKDFRYPYGVRTKKDFVLQRIAGDRTSSLIIWQYGDLARLYRQMPEMSPMHFKQIHRQIIADLAKVTGQIIAKLQPGQMFLLLSADANPIAIKEKSILTPFLMWTYSGEKTGELTSITTRQPGLVSGLDLLPTVYHWIRLPLPEHVIGHVIHTTMNPIPFVSSTEASHVKDNQSDWRISSFFQKIERIHRIYANRPSIIYSFVILQLASLLMGLLLWYRYQCQHRTVSLPMRKFVRFLLTTLLLFPFLLLLEPLVDISLPVFATLSLLVIVAGVMAYWLCQLSLSTSFFLIGAITTIGLLTDGFTGAHLMRRSFLGYDPVIGARFYGMGNEYEGVLIGASLLFFATYYQWEQERERKQIQGEQTNLSLIGLVLIVVSMSIILWYLASPQYGTNAGGFLAAGLAYVVTLLRFYQIRLHKISLLLVGGSLVVGIASLIIINLLSVQPMTHVGKVAHNIVTGNWIEVGQIIRRKLEMNLRLIRVSLWSKVFFLSLFIISVISFYPQQYMRRLYTSYPALVTGFSGIMAGSLAGLFLNDSGIVSAATSIVFFVSPALLLTLQEEKVARKH